MTLNSGLDVDSVAGFSRRCRRAPRLPSVLSVDVTRQKGLVWAAPTVPCRCATAAGGAACSALAQPRQGRVPAGCARSSW